MSDITSHVVMIARGSAEPVDTEGEPPGVGTVRCANVLSSERPPFDYTATGAPPCSAER